MFDMMIDPKDDKDEDEDRLDRGFTGKMARLSYMFCVTFFCLVPIYFVWVALIAD